MKTFEAFKDEYSISTDPERLDVDLIHDFLANRSYWARGVSRTVVEKSIQHSLCFGVYQGEQPAGFARVITDYATSAHICDLFILEEHRGQGLSKWLVGSIFSHPELQGLRRWTLATDDAHGLYARFGFRPLAHPERQMEFLPGKQQ